MNARYFCSAGYLQTSTCSAKERASSTSMPITYSALYLSVTKQKLDVAQIPGIALRSMRPVRRCRLLASQSGVKRTSSCAAHAAYDPKRTSAAIHVAVAETDGTPYQSARLSRYDGRLLSPGAAGMRRREFPQCSGWQRQSLGRSRRAGAAAADAGDWVPAQLAARIEP